MFSSLGSLNFCVCKSCSVDENMDSNWNRPTGLKDDLSLNGLFSKGALEWMVSSEGPDLIPCKISRILPFL